MTRFARLRIAAADFGRARSGLALLEFSLTLPVFLLLSLTGAEITNFITTKMRLSQIALHLADNSARIGSGGQLIVKQISETDINDLLTGAGLLAGELDLYRNGRVIISSVEPAPSPPNPANRYRIGWQRCRGDKTAHRSSYGVANDILTDGIGPSGRKAAAPQGGSTMFVELYYEYKPLVSSRMAPDISITEIASMVVRDTRDLSQIYNSENAPRATC